MSHDQLDIVLDGAEDDIVLQVHQYITNVLRMDFRDPACVGPAARLRLKLEIERMIPARVASAMAEAAAEASAAFLARCETEVAPILKDLAAKAARTSFSDWRTQHIRLVTTLGAAFFLVVGGLTDRLAAHSFQLPAEVAEYVENGNRLVWLNNCPREQLSTQGGRTKCSIAFWMEPPSRPIENGPFADSPVIAEILPGWMQRIVVGMLGLAALALIACPWLPRFSIRVPIVARGERSRWRRAWSLVVAPSPSLVLISPKREISRQDMRSDPTAWGTIAPAGPLRADACRSRYRAERGGGAGRNEK